MATSSSGISISGAGSGIDWQSMISQLRTVEEQSLVPLQNDQTSFSNKLSAWQSFQSKIEALNSAAADIQYDSDFKLFSTNMTSSSSTDASSLLSATTTSSAAQGSYQVVVNSTAQVEKLASGSFSSKSSALNVSGSILVNGHAVNISSTDTLQNLADKINSLNSGDTPTKVTASILQDTSSTYRLVLTSGTTGAAGISLENGSTTDSLTALGFNDGSGTVIKNAVAGGATSDSFTAASGTSVASLLGTSNLSGNVTINGKAVTIDLSQDLNTISSTLNAAGVNSSVVPTTVGTTTTYKLQIEGMSSWTDNNNFLQALGVIEGKRSDVIGTKGSVANTTDGTTAINSSTLVTGIYGYTNWTSGDKITISGTKHDGTAVAATDLSITGSTTVGDLLNQIQTLFGAGTTAGITSDGKIQVVDGNSGTSQLAVNIGTTVQDPNGGVLDFGTFSSVGAVKKYVLQQGRDASFSVDGMAMTSSTNQVTTAIPGVTLNLLGSDSSTTVTVNVDRDKSGIETNVNALISAYNDAISFVNTQMTYNSDSKTTGGALFGDTSLKSIKLQLQNLMMGAVGTGTIKYLSDVGVNVDETGKLSLDKTTFEDKLASNFDDVVHLFTDYGTATDSQFQYVGNTGSTAAGSYTVSLSGLSPIAGTIDGQTATGSDTTLTLSNSSSRANGLQVKYTGSNASASTTFTLTRGFASLLENLTSNLTDPMNGTLTVEENGAQSSIDTYTKKISDMETNIDQKMAALTTQYQNMDAAVGKLKSLQSYLTSQLSSL